VSNNR